MERPLAACRRDTPDHQLAARNHRLEARPRMLVASGVDGIGGNQLIELRPSSSINLGLGN